MGRIGTPLSYWMPETELTVSVTKRREIETEVGADSEAMTRSLLRTAFDVDIAQTAVADPTNRRILEVDSGLFEKIALTITLDDRGFVTAINSEAGHDLSPVISLVGKAVTLAAAVGFAKEESLEEKWIKAHPQLAKMRDALTKQVERLLAAVATPDLQSDAILAAGRALEVVQSQLASVSQVRRDWIAGHAGVEGEAVVSLRPFDLLLLDGPELPQTLPSPFEVPPRQAKFETLGCLVAAIDPDRAKQPTTSSRGDPDVDVIWLRRSRAIAVGVYIRGSDGTWTVDHDTVQHLDVVDRWSGDEPLSLEGAWLRTRTFEFAYHPDMSIKTFGVKSQPSAGTLSTSLGGVLDALGTAREKVSTRAVEARKAADAKTRLELLKATTEFEVLSATREHAAAVALAEQLAKLKS